MHKLIYGTSDFESGIKALYERPAFPKEVEIQASGIIEEVRKRGDEARLCPLFRLQGRRSAAVQGRHREKDRRSASGEITVGVIFVEFLCVA